MGFTVSKKDDRLIAENEGSYFSAYGALELLGLITLYQSKGENWRVSSEKIEEFIQLVEKGVD